MSDLYCEDCDTELRGGRFGDDATCPKCGAIYETDWDYTDADEGCMASWITGKKGA